MGALNGSHGAYIRALGLLFFSLMELDYEAPLTTGSKWLQQLPLHHPLLQNRTVNYKLLLSVVINSR
jgi:hypothetical protein